VLHVYEIQFYITVLYVITANAPSYLFASPFYKRDYSETLQIIECLNFINKFSYDGQFWSQMEASTSQNM